MNRIIRAIHRIAFIGALSMVILTLLKVMEAFAGWWASVIFSACIVVHLVLLEFCDDKSKEKKGPAHD